MTSCALLLLGLVFIQVYEIDGRIPILARGAMLVGGEKRKLSKSAPTHKESSEFDPSSLSADGSMFISQSELRNAVLLKTKVKQGISAGSPSTPQEPAPIAFRQPWWLTSLPKVNLRLDPMLNFKLKQKLTLFGACVTLGLDYLSDIAQWRSYCTIEDRVLRGRFSLRGSELGWAKSWLLNLGLGEENSVKLKLRMGLNLNSCKAYAKLRFRAEPLSPLDLGEGLTCAGKLPLPVYVLPVLKSIPLRVEYRLRLHTISQAIWRKAQHPQEKVAVSTGLGTVDLSLDELNFCLEWDEQSPVWNIGLVRSEPPRRVRTLAPSAANAKTAPVRWRL